MKRQSPKSKGTKSKGGEASNGEVLRRTNDLDFVDVDFGLSSPDMTRQIMGRLGYMRVSPTVARRHRLRRWLGRAGTLLMAVVAIGIAARVYEDSNAVRRTIDITVPAAIGSDFQEHQHRIGNVIRTFRHLTTPPPRPALEESTVPANIEPSVPSEIDGDILEPGLLAFRWV